MRTVIAIQARLGSSRLPNKALIDICGKPLIAQLLRRLRAVRGVDAVVIACPEKDAAAFKRATGINPITGPEDDVLTRILNVANQLEADRIVKVGADCPLAPFDAIEAALERFPNEQVVQNTHPRTFPDGFDFDIWRTACLKALNDVLVGDDREWFASYVFKKYPTAAMTNKVDLSRWRLTVDYPEDVDLIRAIYADMGDEIWTSARITEWCQSHPREMKLNQHRVTDFGARPK